MSKIIKVSINEEELIYSNIIEFVFGREFLYISFTDNSCKLIPLVCIKCLSINRNNKFKQVKIPKR